MSNLDLRPAAVNMVAYYKGDFTLQFTFTEGGDPYPLTGASALFQIKEKNGTVALELTGGSGLTINEAGGIIDLTITNAQIVALSTQEYDYEFIITLSGGTVWPVLDSVFIVSEDGQSEVTSADINVSVDGVNLDVNIIAPAGSGGGTWGSITGTLSDQTDLQTALDGKSDTGHTHPLSDLEQSGATTGQVPKWDGSAWVPDDEAGGGDGIYGGSGTIAQDAVATLTAASFFSIKYSDNNPAFEANDLVGYVEAKAAGGSNRVTVSGEQVDAIAETGNLNLGGEQIAIAVASQTGSAGQPLVSDATFANWGDVAAEFLLVDNSNFTTLTETQGQLLFEEIDAAIGSGGGGGTSYTEITVADLQTAITDGTLTPGGAYLVTDAAGTDGGFYTTAPTNNSINPSGVGIFLNADFQAAGDYSGVEGETGIAAGTQLGIWRLSFEWISIQYTNLSPDYINYSSPSGTLDDGEAYTTDGGHTGTIIHDDGAGTITLIPDQPLSPGEILTGDSSANSVTIDSYTDLGFAAGDTITGANTGATATVVSDDGSTMVAYMTTQGVAFDGVEVLDNFTGTTADMNGAASAPDIVQGDVVIWNLLHYQLTDGSAINGTDPASNAGAYTLLSKSVANVGYITAYDVAEWDQVNDWLARRLDANGNDQDLPFSVEAELIGNGIMITTLFQWGRNGVIGNSNNGGVMDIKNNIGLFSYNTLYQGARIGSIMSGDGTIFRNNILENGAQLTSIIAGANCSISQNKIGQSATLGGTTTMYEASTLNGNVLGSGAQLIGLTIGVTAGSECNFNQLEVDATMSAIILNSGGNASSNKIGASGSINTIELGVDSALNGNDVASGGNITGITAGEGCSILRNTVGQGATLGDGTTIGDQSAISDNELHANAEMKENTLGSESDITFNILQPQSHINNNTVPNNEGISGNYLSANSAIIANTGTFGTNTLLSGAHIENKTMASGQTMEQCSFTQVFVDITETISTTTINKRVQAGYSDFAANIDITGLTTLDITAAFAQYRGIINLTSSNATESIDAISNFPTLFPFQLRPAAGLALTVTGTAIGGVGAGQIVLKATDYTLDGDKGEYIELVADPTNTYLVEKQVLTGIL